MIDDYKALTKSDLLNILRIAFNLDYNKWSADMDIKVKERLKQLDEEMNMAT